jgi:uncharacterized protein YegP (UPF0339 family)
MTMFELYKDGKGEWRWRLIAHNKKIIADSGEGYIKRSGARKAVERVKALVAIASIVEVLHNPEQAHVSDA